MQAEGTQHPLETVLQEAVDCTHRLLACLEAERDALTRRDTLALEKTTRESIMAELGFGNDKDGLQRCFSSLAQTDRLQALWQKLHRNLESCHDSNITNGGILELGRQHVEQALGILRGQSGTPSQYEPSGSTSADLGQRDLGKV